MLFQKFIETAKMNIKRSLAYIGALWSGIFVSLIEIAIFYYIWRTAYSSTEIIGGVSSSEIVTYVVLSRILYMQVAWGINVQMSESIQTGDIILDLLKPFNYQIYLYSQRMGSFIYSLFTEGIPALLVALIFFKITLPYSFVNLVLFFASIFMSITLAFLIEFAVGLITFYTANGWGLQFFKFALLSFLSGAMFPITFLPYWLQNIVNVLPFKDLIYTPIIIYLGKYTGAALFKALFLQFIWICIMLLFTRLIYMISIRKLTVQGG